MCIWYKLFSNTIHSSHTFFIISFHLAYSVKYTFTPIYIRIYYYFTSFSIAFFYSSSCPLSRLRCAFFCLSASNRNLNYFLLNYLSFSTTCSCHDMHTNMKMCNDNDSGCCSAACTCLSPRLLKVEKVDSVYCVIVTICAACSQVVI